MIEISDHAKDLLNVLASNKDGSSRWAAADLAQIYERAEPDVNKTIEELTNAALIMVKQSEVGRRKTDQLQVTPAGVEFAARAQG